MRGFGLGVAGTTVKAITVPLEFSNVTETVPGQSVLVVGNIPHGGNWAPTYVTKLVPHDCSGSKFDRMAWIGIAPGTSFQYKFIKCNDRAPATPMKATHSGSQNPIVPEPCRRVQVKTKLFLFPWLVVRFTLVFQNVD